MTGKQIKKKIMEIGLKQKDVAAKLGLSTQALGERLKDGKTVNSDFMEEVAAAMGVTVADLYSQTPIRNNGADSILEERKKEKELLRRLSTAAMQGILAAAPDLKNERFAGITYEKGIAQLSVDQAYAMLDEFKKRGIDK